MALHSLYCADVPLRNRSLTQLNLLVFLISSGHLLDGLVMTTVTTTTWGLT